MKRQFGDLKFRELIKKAWYYLNDCFLTSLCIYLPVNIIVASCFYLAMRILDIPLPDLAWWILFESKLDHIHEACGELLILYEQKAIDLIQVKTIIDNCLRSKNILKQFTFKYMEE